MRFKRTSSKLRRRSAGGAVAPHPPTSLDAAPVPQPKPDPRKPTAQATPLRIIEGGGRTTATPGVRLYRLVYEACRAHADRGVLLRHNAPERSEVQRRAQILVTEGIASGELVPADAAFVAWSLANLAASAGQRDEPSALPPAERARRLTDFALRALLRDPMRLEFIRGEVARQA